MISIRIGKKSFEVPQSLNELSQKQLLKLVDSVYLRTGTDNENFRVKRMELLRILLGESKLFYEYWKKDAAKECMAICSEDCLGKCVYNHTFLLELRELLELTSPFYDKITIDESPVELYTLRMSLSKQLIPSFRIWGVRFEGPTNAMEDLSFESWINADLAYMHFMKTGDNKFLDMLIAELYEPSIFKWIGLAVPFFDKKRFYNGAKWVGRLDMRFKMAIFLFYVSSRAFLAEHFNKVFRIPGKDEIKKNSNDIIRSQWYETRYSIAENGLFGDFDRVGKTKIGYILKHIQMMVAKREKEQERRELAAIRRK